MSRASCGGKAPDYAMKWKTIADDTARLKIPEGWIYRTKTGPYSSPAMVFVPEQRSQFANDPFVALDREHRLRPSRQPERGVLASPKPDLLDLLRQAGDAIAKQSSIRWSDPLREAIRQAVGIPADRVKAEPVTVAVEPAVIGFCGWCHDAYNCKSAGHCLHDKERIPPGMSCGGIVMKQPGPDPAADLARLRSSTAGDKHEGCTKGGTWRADTRTANLVDVCDGCGEERA